MISHIVCYRTDPFWSGNEGQLIAQKVATVGAVTHCDSQVEPQGTACVVRCHWSTSLCLLVSWIFHKFRIKKVVLYSGQLTCRLMLPWEKDFFRLTFSSTSIPGPNWKTHISKYHAYMFHLIMRVPTCAVSCCWTVSGWSSEIKKNELLYLQQLIASFVTRCSFHLMLSAAGY